MNYNDSNGIREEKQKKRVIIATDEHKTYKVLAIHVNYENREDTIQFLFCHKFNRNIIDKICN